jgi:cytochrome c biogenesis protein CcmG/thiol:disulfide interchange protein DsbE
MTDVAMPSSRPSRARWIALAVFALIAVLVVVLATRPAANTKVASSPLVGQPAPEVAGTSLDGRPVSLSSLRGRYAVVNFFATWCGPCREEHPELRRFTESNPSPTAPAVIAVAYDERDINATRNFFTQYGGSWPVVPDNGGRIAVDYGVRGLPESYVVDPQGNIAAHITGQVTAATLNQLTGQPS